ncbi:MAG: YebC/PmpR family DNA-binding transcriptional regulator [Thermodesulfobacteriota bacterium]
MSGHSKWSTIKHKKARTDAKKGKVFSKLIKEIIVAAKAGGGDVDGNARLRTAVAKAKGENVPNDNIDRAIKKGSGELECANYEEFFYEGYGAGGVAVLVAISTDSRNRAAADVRHAFTKCGGRMGENGSVAWMFEQKGLLTFDLDSVSEEKLFEAAIEAGADDVVTNSEDNVYEVYTSPSAFNGVLEALDGEGLKYNVAEVSYLPKNTVEVKGSAVRQVLRLMEELEELDDVQNVFANFDISAKDMEEVA